MPNDDDLYSQRDMPPDKSTKRDKEDSDDDGEDEQKTALIPKSIVNKDCKPGEKLKCEVVHVYDDELEIKVTGYDKDKDKDKDEDPKETRDKSERELDGMATDNY